jgi:IS1 family transposase
VRHGRRRRYRCVGGGGTFSGRIDTAYYRFRCSPRTFDRVAHMAVEGMSRAAIARIEDVGWNTVNRWLTKAAGFAQRFNDARTRNIELIELQADEIRTFAPAKARPTWIFTSMEVCSRLWVSTVVGRRCYRNTHALFSDTLARGVIIGIPLIATDGLKFYAHVVRRLFGPVCIYGQVIKSWRKDRVTRVERRPVIGTSRRLEEALEQSQDSVRLNTAYIERLNLTLRRSVSYLARRSPGHARCPGRLTDQLELARCHYNFLRPHAGLRFGQETRTPAMVAGLSHRALSFRDIFVPAPTNS